MLTLVYLCTPADEELDDGAPQIRTHRVESVEAAAAFLVDYDVNANAFYLFEGKPLNNPFALSTEDALNRCYYERRKQKQEEQERREYERLHRKYGGTT